jgi:hypothetical protein
MWIAMSVYVLVAIVKHLSQPHFGQPHFGQPLRNATDLEFEHRLEKLR